MGEVYPFETPLVLSAVRNAPRSFWEQQAAFILVTFQSRAVALDSSPARGAKYERRNSNKPHLPRCSD